MLGDVVGALTGTQTLAAPTARLEFVEDVVSAFYVHLEVDDLPGVLAQVAQRFGDAGASIKSVVQQGGNGERAQLMLVTHPLPRSRLAAALEAIVALEQVLAAPRAISVINEEFV